jgi:ACS family glucarate transporter-like MFS transporter
MSSGPPADPIRPAGIPLAPGTPPAAAPAVAAGPATVPFDAELLQQPTSVRWWIFALACATSWLLYLHRYSWGVIKPAFKRENPNLTDVELGWLDSAFNATYALGQVPGGLAGDLFGPRAVLSLFVLSWSLCLAALALVAGFWVVCLVRAAFGLAQAGTYPVLGKVTRNWFPLRTRTTVQGVITALGRVGAACSSVLVATLLIRALGLSWRDALLVLAAPGLGLAVVVWLVFRNSPAEHPWANPAEQRLVEGPASAAAAPGATRLHWNRSGLPTLVALLAYAFFSTFADMLYVFWIPLFLVEGKGLGPGEMGVFATLPLLGGALGGIVAGGLNDYLIGRLGRRAGRTSVACTGKFLAGVLLASSIFVADGRLVMLVVLVCRFFADWSLPTQWGAITDIAGKASGTVFGVINMTGSIGAFVAGPVLGLWKQHWGWEGLFLGVAGVYALAAACWLFIDSTRPVLREEPAPSA